MPPKDPPTKSGITHLPTGDAIIPASTRPDGSVRKEIRVKPGYRPPEDVELYKNRTAEAWKNRGKGGGVPGAAKADVGPGEKGGAAGAAAANKNAKRREARKKAAGAATNGSDGVSTAPAEQADGSATSQAAAAAPPVDAEAEAAKEARKLAKKLRQARELKEKQAAGAADGTALLPEQLAKVMRVQELVRQLDALGFDGEGERKTGKSEGGGGAGTEGSGGEEGAKEEGEEEARAAG